MEGLMKKSIKKAIMQFISTIVDGELMAFLTYSKVQDGQYLVHKIDSLCDTLYGPCTHFNPHMNVVHAMNYIVNFLMMGLKKGYDKN